MDASAHFPSVRLATSGYASLAVLAWMTLVPGAVPHLDPRRGTRESFISAVLALIPLLVLVPVFWRGPSKDRWLASLIALFPALLVGTETISFTLAVLYSS